MGLTVTAGWDRNVQTEKTDCMSKHAVNIALPEACAIFLNALQLLWQLVWQVVAHCKAVYVPLSRVAHKYQGRLILWGFGAR